MLRGQDELTEQKKQSQTGRVAAVVVVVLVGRNLMTVVDPRARIKLHLTVHSRPLLYGGFGRKVLFVGCLTSQQHAGVSQGRICSDNCTCCHTETEVADQTFYLTQSQYTDTGPTSSSTDPIMPGARQCSHWSTNFEVTV